MDIETREKIYENLEKAHNGVFEPTRQSRNVHEVFTVSPSGNFMDLKGTNVRIWRIGLIESIANTFPDPAPIMFRNLYPVIDRLFEYQVIIRFYSGGYGRTRPHTWSFYTQVRNSHKESRGMDVGHCVDLDLNYSYSFESALEKLRSA